MIKGIGLDLCGIDRMEALVTDGRFLAKYYTPLEQAYIADRGQMTAASAAGMPLRASRQRSAARRVRSAFRSSRYTGTGRKE